MDDEIHAIEKNDIQELTNFPADKKPIGVKWVYKTKYNPNGEIDDCYVQVYLGLNYIGINNLSLLFLPFCANNWNFNLI